MTAEEQINDNEDINYNVVEQPAGTKNKDNFFDFSVPKNNLEVFLFYLLMMTITIFIIGIISASMMGSEPPSFEQGLKIGQQIGMWATPITTILYSLPFIIYKKLYKRPSPYFMVIIAALLPPIIGYILIACLGKFQKSN